MLNLVGHQVFSVDFVCDLWPFSLQLPNTHAHSTHKSFLRTIRITALVRVQLNYMEPKRVHELGVLEHTYNKSNASRYTFFISGIRGKNWRHWLVLCHFFCIIVIVVAVSIYIRYNIIQSQDYWHFVDEAVALTVKWRAFSAFVTIALKPYAAYICASHKLLSWCFR